MFIDARGIADAAALNSAVCIAGGGVAGIALALELARAGIDVIVVESGGFRAEKATDALCRGASDGLPYAFDHRYRSRYFGGSSNCWGVWSRPLEPEDFAGRDWIPYSGWPLDARDLQPFYARAHTLLQLGPHNFEAEFWGRALTGAAARRLPLAATRIADSFSQFSPPARLGRSHRSAIERAPHLRVLLHANAVNIRVDPSARTATALDVATLSGKRFRVAARYFVLAMGGIENARLLLASNGTCSAGLGNDRDLVGRFFMDHPRLQAGTVRLRQPWQGNRLYDIKYQKARLLRAHDTAVAAQLVLRPAVVSSERLLHARTWFRPVFIREHSPLLESLYRFAHDTRAPGAMPLARAALQRLFAAKPLLRALRCEIIVEPDPNPASRVTLAADKDALDVPRARVTWQLGELVQKTAARTLQIIGEELARAGIADVALPPLFPERRWPADLQGTWHHMGTTRMSEAPERGVVDRDCRVHGMSNLYIAGSSVFPTGGANFPTLTLAALALRLAAHLRAALAQPRPAAAGRFRTGTDREDVVA